MKKSILLMLLTISTIVASAQTEFSTPKYGSILMECFYNLKISSSTSLCPDDQEKLKQRITDMCGYLETQLTTNKSIMLRKLGSDDFNELAHQIENYQTYATLTNDMLTLQQEMSIRVFVKLSKNKIEKIFAKLNKS